MLMTRHLIETELCAVLVSPRTTSRVYINSSLGKQISIIVRRCHTWHCSTKFDNLVEDLGIRIILGVGKQLAKCSSVSVLNTFYKNISIEEHEVITSHSLAFFRKGTFDFIGFTFVV